MPEFEKTEYKFPDEIEDSPTDIEDEIEVVIVDDTPEEDRGRQPMPKHIVDELEEDKWPEYKPHVTVNANMDVVDIPIVNYILIQANEILWSLKPIDLEKSEEILEKGAMKRLYGFNPQDMAPED